MKLKQKLLGILTAVACAVNAFSCVTTSFIAEAEEEKGIAVGNMEVEYGTDSVQLPLSLIGDYFGLHFAITLSCDEPLSIVDFSGVITSDCSNSKSASAEYAIPNPKEGEFAEVEISISEDAEPGVYPVDITVDLLEESGTEVENPVLYSGSVTITETLATEEESNGIWGDLTYSTFDSDWDGTDDMITITGCDASVTSVDIPDKINGMPVNEIGDDAFAYCYDLSNLTMPDTITQIGDRAFYECQSLSSIIFPVNVTSIGDNAFSHCSNITDISIPDSVTSIGKQAFESCLELESITVGANNTNYSSANGVLFNKDKTELITFPPNSKITKLTIPNSVKNINDYAFADCNNLTSVVISDGVTEIGNNAFNYCKGLINLTISSTVTSIGNYAFYYCSSLTSITIPDSVTSIGICAFYNCLSLESIVIGSGVTRISDRLFYYCTKLKDITISSNVKEIGTGAFLYCSGIVSITIPDSVTSIAEDAFYGCTGLESINVFENNKAYCSVDGVFFNKDMTTLIQFPASNSIISYTIPDSVTRICKSAFYNCLDLKSVIIPESVTSIGFESFANCSGLTEIVIPESVTSIGSYAFSCCFGLKSIIIPESVISLESEAFYSCRNMTKAVIGSSIIGNYAFENCESLTDVTITSHVEEIGHGAFGNCSSLKTLTISDGVVNLYMDAFYGCTSLESFNVSDNNTAYSSVDGVLFDKEKTSLIKFPVGKALTEYVIPDSVQTIYASAFSYATNLKNVTIPDGVAHIENYGFAYCSSLKEVVIPDSVETVSYNAFYYCESLESITFKNPECSIYDDIETICTGYQNDDSAIYDNCYFNGTIYGYTNSTAQIYAENYGRKFVALDSEQFIDPSLVTKYGDLNNDNDVNVSDVVKINLYLLNKVENPLDAVALANADCVRDGVIDTSDGSLILNYTAMMISYDKLGAI